MLRYGNMIVTEGLHLPLSFNFPSWDFQGYFPLFICLFMDWKIPWTTKLLNSCFLKIGLVSTAPNITVGVQGYGRISEQLPSMLSTDTSLGLSFLCHGVLPRTWVCKSVGTPPLWFVSLSQHTINDHDACCKSPHHAKGKSKIFLRGGGKMQF